MISGWTIKSDPVQASTPWNSGSLLFSRIHLIPSARSYALGEQTFKRYPNLITRSGDAPFVRASGEERVILSAGNWTLGRTVLRLLVYRTAVD